MSVTTDPAGASAQRARRPVRSTIRNALALAALTIKLSFRDRRAFVVSLVFPLTFLFLFGLMASQEGPAVLRELISRVVSLTVLVGSFFGQGLGLAVQRERGMLRRYRLTPLGAGGLLGGTALAGLFMVFLTITIQLTLWRLQFGQPRDLEVGRFLLAVTVAALSMASLGLVVAAVASTMQEAQILFQVTFMASLVLSDITVPLDYLPAFLQRVSVFLPATHASRVLRHALDGHTPLSFDALALAALALMTVTAFYVAARLFRWERDDPLPRRAKWSALLALLPVIAFGLWQNTRPAPQPVYPVTAPPPGVESKP